MAHKPCTTDINDYDCLIVCCPVWASRTPPGLNQYLEGVRKCSGKKFAALVTMGGNGNRDSHHPDPLNALEGKGMEFVDKWSMDGDAQKSGEWETKIQEFAEKFQG